MSILSVHPSTKRLNCDKTEEKSVQIFIPYERSFSLVEYRPTRIMSVNIVSLTHILLSVHDIWVYLHKHMRVCICSTGSDQTQITQAVAGIHNCSNVILVPNVTKAVQHLRLTRAPIVAV